MDNFSHANNVQGQKPAWVNFQRFYRKSEKLENQPIIKKL